MLKLPINFNKNCIYCTIIRPLDCTGTYVQDCKYNNYYSRCKLNFDLGVLVIVKPKIHVCNIGVSILCLGDIFGYLGFVLLWSIELEGHSMTF